jgi:hypothetical protein
MTSDKELAMKPSRRARLTRLSLILAGTCALALAFQGPAAHAAPAAQTCRGTFSVLHNDRVAEMAVPRGAYSVRATGVSCSGAAKLIGRFLDDFDGVLPGGWTTAASGVGFTNPATGASITMRAAGRPAGAGSCPGTFAVEHDDRVGSLALPAGGYVIRTRNLSCSAASQQFAAFLYHDSSRRLPSGWTLDPSARRFAHGVASFTVTRAGGTSGGGLHPSRSITCPGTVTLAAGTSLDSLVLPAGQYYVNVFSDYACPSATASFRRFAAAGALPAQWTLEPQTGTFLLGKQGFQVEPVR